MSKEEFLSQPNTNEELYYALQNSKQGWIKISRIGDGNGDSGFTLAFGEGISCKISNSESWYITSMIQNIDWENHTFKTLNSTYNFEFKDFIDDEKERIKKFEELNNGYKN